MLTRIAPIFAVAYCTIVHSGQFGAQMPTRSPRFDAQRHETACDHVDFVVEFARTSSCDRLPCQRARRCPGSPRRCVRSSPRWSPRESGCRSGPRLVTSWLHGAPTVAVVRQNVDLRGSGAWPPDQSVSHRGSRRRSRRPAGQAGPHPMAGGRMRRRLEPGHPAGVHPRTGRLLGQRLRLARARSRAEPIRPVHHRNRRSRHPFHPSAIASATTPSRW